MANPVELALCLGLWLQMEWHEIKRLQNYTCNQISFRPKVVILRISKQEFDWTRSVLTDQERYQSVLCIGLSWLRLHFGWHGQKILVTHALVGQCVNWDVWSPPLIIYKAAELKKILRNDFTKCDMLMLHRKSPDEVLFLKSSLKL